VTKRKAKRSGGPRTKSTRTDRSTSGQSAAFSQQLAVSKSFERLSEYIESASSFEEAAAAARADLISSADEISRLACGLDLITVVSSVRVMMIMDRAMTGIDISTAILELIALTLACRDAASGEPATAPDRSRFMPPHIEAAAQEALGAGSMIALFESPRSGPEDAIVFFSTQREITLRNPVYPHMLLDTLRGLFANRAVDAECRAVLGFTGQEAVEVMEAVRTLSVAKLADRFDRMEAARDASLPALQAWRRRHRDDTQIPPEEHRSAVREVIGAVEDLTTNISRATVIDPAVVAEQTGHDRSTVEAVLDAYTATRFTDIAELLERFFRGDNPLRTAPIVTDTQGRRMLVHDALALPAVREVIETRLKAASRQDAYERHRGQWVENAAVDLLAGVFPGADVFRGFQYFVPDPRAATPETDPEKYTKRVEGDGLIIVDDVALIIEVKSVTLTAEARGGVARRLRGKLRDIVTEAANQAGRLRERILADKRIRLKDGQWIDVSGIREIHTIAVGLEDLSGVTTATTMLLAAGVLQPGHIPWTVSVHDLRIVCELLDRPSELLLYLRRRTEPEATWKYRAVDELDLFLLFLELGLYVEPDPRERAQALPWSGQPSAADLRRFAAQQPELVISQTAPLDVWYDSQLDPTAEAATKPQLEADQKVLDLVDLVSATNAPGWLSTAVSLLEGDAKVQRRLGRQAAELAKLVRQDGHYHTATHLMPKSSGEHILLIWACLTSDNDDATVSHLLRYLQAKKHQAGTHRATCMIFDPTGKRLLRLLYDNRPPGPDPALDADLAHLVPLEKMRPAIPPRRRRKRRS
jgi:hypothetical protein